MRDTLATILQSKGGTVHAIEPAATVLEAVRAMNHHHIGCLLVMQGEEVVGIFTERDVLTRILEHGRDPAATSVSEVMTQNPVAVRPTTTVDEAMAVITEKRCRHLPVLDGGRLLGMVSIGDLTRWVTRNQAYRIQDLVNYITGRYPV